jgi:ribulose 1,5-bisphosphate synthetase/thiazole synthase
MGWIGLAVAVGLTLAAFLGDRGMKRVSGERGWKAGVGYWLGVSTFTVPITILAFWIVRLFL